MPVAVAMPNRQEEKDPLDKLAAALNIAKTIYGIHHDGKALEQAKLERAERQKSQGLQDERNQQEVDKNKAQSAQDAATSGPLYDAMAAQMKARGGNPQGLTVGQMRTSFDAFLKPKEPKEGNPLLDEMRRQKMEELSVGQAKQLGLYQLGQKAEQQYLKAVSDKDDYDPTASGQLIDNSQWAPNAIKNNKAIAAQAAMSSWVEAFLRDASGAAIPAGERLDYAKDFFPMPGDTTDVVANKAELRKQKMENALVGAGPKAMVARGGAPQEKPAGNSVAGYTQGGKPVTDINAAIDAALAKKRNSVQVRK